MAPIGTAAFRAPMVDRVAEGPVQRRLPGNWAAPVILPDKAAPEETARPPMRELTPPVVVVVARVASAALAFLPARAVTEEWGLPTRYRDRPPTMRVEAGAPA